MIKCVVKEYGDLDGLEFDTLTEVSIPKQPEYSAKLSKLLTKGFQIENRGEFGVVLQSDETDSVLATSRDRIVVAKASFTEGSLLVINNVTGYYGTDPEAEIFEVNDDMLKALPSYRSPVLTSLLRIDKATFEAEVKSMELQQEQERIENEKRHTEAQKEMEERAKKQFEAGLNWAKESKYENSGYNPFKIEGNKISKEKNTYDDESCAYEIEIDKPFSAYYLKIGEVTGSSFENQVSTVYRIASELIDKGVEKMKVSWGEKERSVEVVKGKVHINGICVKKTNIQKVLRSVKEWNEERVKQIDFLGSVRLAVLDNAHISIEGKVDVPIDLSFRTKDEVVMGICGINKDVSWDQIKRLFCITIGNSKMYLQYPQFKKMMFDFYGKSTAETLSLLKDCKMIKAL